MNLSFINNNIFIVEEAFPIKETELQAKKVLLILHQNESVNASLMAFLHKILAAIKCDAEKDTWSFAVADGKHFSIAQIKSTYPSAFIIVFGIEPAELGFHAQTKKYVFTSIGDTQYLFCDALSEIEKLTPLKAALWDALKKLLN